MDSNGATKWSDQKELPMDIDVDVIQGLAQDLSNVQNTPDLVQTKTKLDQPKLSKYQIPDQSSECQGDFLKSDFYSGRGSLRKRCFEYLISKVV